MGRCIPGSGMADGSDEGWDGASMETRVAILRLQANTHERTCAARWGIALKLLWAILGVVVAYAAWSSKTLYENNQEQMRELRAMQAHAPTPRSP